jgi:hypothetical protein
VSGNPYIQPLLLKTEKVDEILFFFPLRLLGQLDSSFVYVIDEMAHKVKILFSVISSPITLERQKRKSSKMKGILLSSPVNS